MLVAGKGAAEQVQYSWQPNYSPALLVISCSGTTLEVDLLKYCLQAGL